MASAFPPKKNTAFSFEIGLYSQADSTALKSGPTLAAGDFKYSLDGSAPASITNTPTASGTVVTVALVAAEMNGDRVHIVWQDAAGAEWISSFANYFMAAATQDEISARIPTALDANGFMKSDVEDWKGSTAPAMTGDAFARLGAPVGASTSADVAAVKAVLPAALVGGRIDASVGAMAAGVHTAAAFGVDAIDATALAANAATEIAAAVLAATVEGSSSLKQMVQDIGAAAAGKNTGAGTGTVTFRNVSDTVDALVATVDGSNNRTAITRTRT